MQINSTQRNLGFGRRQMPKNLRKNEPLIVTYTKIFGGYDPRKVSPEKPNLNLMEKFLKIFKKS